MGIFDRLIRVIKANVNSAIDKAEDPEIMLNQVITDMNAQLVEAKRAVATAIADEKRLERQVSEYEAKSKEWESRAVLALREAEKDPSKQAYLEDLARQALLHRKENQDIADKLQEQLTTQHAAVEKLKQSLKEMQQRLEESQRKKSLLVARAKRAEATKKIQETVAGMSDNSAFQAFERMAQKVDQIEAEADALAELESSTRSPSLEQEFAKLEAGSKGDNLLQEFKEKIALEKEQERKSLGEGKKAAGLNVPKQEQNPANNEVDMMMLELKKKLRSGN